MVEQEARPDAEEHAFVAALRRGAPDALGELVDRYGARLYTFAARMCHNDEDAKDILQDTFLAALCSVGDFRGEAKLSTWLFRIAVNACRKMHRRGKFEPAHHLGLDDVEPWDEEQAFLACAAETPEAALLRVDSREALQAAIAALPPSYRAVIILRDVEGLSTEEAADALGVTAAAVKVRLHRARLAVRGLLAQVR